MPVTGLEVLPERQTKGSKLDRAQLHAESSQTKIEAGNNGAMIVVSGVLQAHGRPAGRIQWRLQFKVKRPVSAVQAFDSLNMSTGIASGLSLQMPAPYPEGIIT